MSEVGQAAGEDLDRLLAWGAARRIGCLLDLSMGAGRTVPVFATLARRVVAIVQTESTPSGDRPRGVGNVDLVGGDGGALPFRDGSFDVVTWRAAAHHVADVGAVVRQIQRVLRSGGALLLQDVLGHDDAAASAFMSEVERRRDPSHVRGYRAAEWKAFLRAAGLTVMEDVVVPTVRVWGEWTSRTRMTGEARRRLEAFVRAAPEPCRTAFGFKLTGDGVESFTDRQILLRAERD